MSSLSNSVAVLRLFTTERTELSVTEVSRDLAMPKSSASRLLKAMLQERLLANVPKTPRYRIGHLFFEISRLYGRRSTLMDLASSTLHAICRETRHGGYISMLDGADVLVLRVYLGPEPLRVVTPLGSRMPAFATSTGRTLLARLGNEAIKALHPRPLTPPSANGPQTLDDLLRSVEQVRRVGWCEAIDEGVPGVASVAVTIADAQSGDALAFCQSFPAHLVSELERRRLASVLTDAAREIATQVDDAFWNKMKPQHVAAA